MDPADAYTKLRQTRTSSSSTSSIPRHRHYRDGPAGLSPTASSPYELASGYIQSSTPRHRVSPPGGSGRMYYHLQRPHLTGERPGHRVPQRTSVGGHGVSPFPIRQDWRGLAILSSEGPFAARVVRLLNGEGERVHGSSTPPPSSTWRHATSWLAPGARSARG